MINYIIYLIIKTLSRFFSNLSTESALCLGRIIGRVVYVLYPNRKGVAYTNLIAAFGKDKNHYEIKRICRETFINLTQTVIEILRLPLIDEEYLRKYLKINGMHYIDSALKERRGAVLLTAHFGNWELLAITIGMVLSPIKVLARKQKPEEVNDLLNAYRESKGSKVIGKGFEIRGILRALRNGEAVGILADQDAGKNGIFIDFFNRPASTHSGAINFAFKTKADVIPCFIIRGKGPYHKVEINPPLKISYNQKKDIAIKKGLKEFSKILSKYIINNPAQWLWFHKRWKSSPPTSIMVLNDGKTGHLNQSKSVVKKIKGVIRQEYPNIDVEVNQVNIKFKNKIYRIITNIFSNFCTRRFIIDFNWFKIVLKENSYKQITCLYSDIIVSCGSSLEGVNLMLKKQLDVKNVIVMKPSIASLKKFDLALIPAHDKVKKSNNVFTTKGALNLVEKETLEKSIKVVEDKIGYSLKSDKTKLGILLGGNTKNYKISIDKMKFFLDKIIEALEKFDMELLLTTSRRTPEEIEKLIKKKVKGHNRCKLLIIANEKNIPGVVPAILGSSDTIIVSGESISMVSEAVASGKKIIVFEPERRKSIINMLKYSDKHQRFLKTLYMNKQIVLTKTKDIDISIEKIMQEDLINKEENNQDKIDKLVYRLL